MSPTVTGVSGTQSPPLEFTGEHKPMGASSVESAQKGEQVEAVPDYEQRKQYFEEIEQDQSNSKPAKRGERLVGQSLQDDLEKRA
ncbi:hypothetical protein EV361DRAFT_963910 [Lentinula raphanica]|uniref:Uncharacterized protein n=1 Tax=Lentinula raphanica TaxID=153919 RepID=A0AA38P7X5_9AGAR|nr:hypothetical protein EV360DRAFT_87014 [Lentinula raphanica]KAJ3837760.1 hypothetical protein F5878DRAFT_201156 [Lentinula raphanica]KAJ3969689.1 hypothetical protein EV361DRAFT_963910 [Lentinula raphanica]